MRTTQAPTSPGKCRNQISDTRYQKLTAAPIEPPQKFEIQVENRKASDNRKIAEMLVNQLASTKKYNRAIKSGDFATFSFIGTKDWEDYASLSVQALTLLTLTNIDKNLEEINAKLSQKDLAP